MKTYQIEDTIIAYFDGRLNDTESAELMHRVSVSPEIRDLFEQHRALRQLAVRAARNISIAPELEEAVFSRIEALEQEERLPAGWWSLRRISTMTSVIALLLLAVTASWETYKQPTTFAHSPALVAASVKDMGNPASTEWNGTRISFIGRDQTKVYHALRLSQRSNSNVQYAQNSDVRTDAPLGKIAPRQTLSAGSVREPAGEYPTLPLLRELPEDATNARFEFAVGSPMGSFIRPSSFISNPPNFSTVAFRAGYNLDEKNQLAIQLTEGSIAELKTVSSLQQGYMLVTGQQQYISGYAGELFYRHREPVEQGLFFVTGSIGGGFYSMGSMLSAELGIEIPFGNRLLGGVSFELNRFHQNGSEASNLSSPTPVLYSGSSVYNTLVGGIDYALTYRF